MKNPNELSAVVIVICGAAVFYLGWETLRAMGIL